MEKKSAYIYDWAIVEGEKADSVQLVSAPEEVYAFLTTEKNVDLALFGRVKNDYRASESTTDFTDGHRVCTSSIFEVKMDGMYTKNTHYTLGEISSQYAEWCEEKGHDIFGALKEGRIYDIETTISEAD